MDFKIDWSSKSKLRGPGEHSVGDLVRKLCAKLSPQTKGVSISYVDDRGMRKINKLHRGLNKTTDVLSFPASPEKGESHHLGDIVISLETAEKKAKRLGVSRRRQVEALIIHGFLHLCGYDHEKDKGEMAALQSALEREMLEEEPLPTSRKRGRKPGSKLKTLKSGERVVVTGRAAQAIIRREKTQKEKPSKAASKAKEKAKAASKPKAAAKKPKSSKPRRLVAGAAAKPAAKRHRKKRVAKIRSGVIS